MGNDYLSLLGYGTQSPGFINQFGSTPETLPVGLTNAFGSSPVAPALAGSGGNNLFTLDSFLGKDGQAGWGGAALGALQGIGNAFMGMKQYGLAKDALQASKDQFAKNYAAQRSTVNAELEDRQRARVAATAGGAESVESYMARNRIQ